MGLIVVWFLIRMFLLFSWIMWFSFAFVFWSWDLLVCFISHYNQIKKGWLQLFCVVDLFWIFIQFGKIWTGFLTVSFKYLMFLLMLFCGLSQINVLSTHMSDTLDSKQATTLLICLYIHIIQMDIQHQNVTLSFFWER